MINIIPQLKTSVIKKDLTDVRSFGIKIPLVGQRRPALPRTYSAVPSALGGLTSGFGMGPGVPPLPWSLTNKRYSRIKGFSHVP